jgi:uncharacterized protein YaiE (UPF0345 family)
MTVQTVPAYLQNAPHSAALFRQAVSNPFSSVGVLAYGEFAVGAQSTPNMSVLVGAGRALVPGSLISPPTLLSGATGAFTTQANYTVLNDASVTLTVATADPTNPRIDTVYVTVQDAYYSGSNNQVVLGVVTGTPAASPVVSAAPSNSLVLGYVAVAANATSIVAGNISQPATVAGGLASAPYAVAQGTGTIGAVAAGASVNSTITFPTGRFTVAPFVYVTPLSSRVTGGLSSVSSSGATVNWGNWSPGTMLATGFDWVAVQMTSTAAAG